MRKQLILSVLFILSAVSVTACKSKVNDVEPAKVGQTDEAKQEIKEEKEEPAPTAKSKEVAVDNPASSIKFIGAKITGDHDGGFSKWGGTASLSADNQLEKLDISIEMNSVYTDDDDVNVETYKQNDPNAPKIENGRLDKHLMDADFFDVAQFPTATFVSTKIETSENVQDFTHLITGNLNFHGVEKQISFPAKVAVANGRMTAFADFTINRFDFGVKYEGKKDDLIKKEVRLIILLDFPVEG